MLGVAYLFYWSNVRGLVHVFFTSVSRVEFRLNTVFRLSYLSHMWEGLHPVWFCRALTYTLLTYILTYLLTYLLTYTVRTYLHRTYIVLTPYLHCTYTVLTPYLHRTYTILTLYLHRTYTVLTPYLHRTYTVLTLYVLTDPVLT